MTNVNQIGLTSHEYQGGPSTLCPGCGHNAISSQIVAVAHELGFPPFQFMKFSGIGCSSKTPAYFLNRAHGFNTVHGRMPAVATGAILANQSLIAIGVSGDGDTGSIGLGQFKHLIRRNTPMVYLVENNGVYGLTKGQHSATADIGQRLKHAGANELPPLDLCLEALITDCGFVARLFAGDGRQVRESLKAAMTFRGTAVLDIISPCVAFNNRPDSTKSYEYGKEHADPIQDLQFIPACEEIQVDYAEGATQLVTLHTGSVIKLKKLDKTYDPTSKQQAMMLLAEASTKQEFITGLIYINEQRPTLPELLHLPVTPLAQLPDEKLRPGPETLSQVLATL